LQHYLDFRTTMDVDAWWADRILPETQALLNVATADLARRHDLTLEVRSSRDTSSYELKRGTRKTFSFQIALRDVQLDAPLASAWHPVQIETLRDNIGARMNALVNRGAPRDFIDLHALCARGLANPAGCWESWRAKNPGRKTREAVVNVLQHQAALEARRPLSAISAPADRQAAAALREWYRTKFVRGATP
jgi:hypothetical protein